MAYSKKELKPLILKVFKENPNKLLNFRKSERKQLAQRGSRDGHGETDR